MDLRIEVRTELDANGLPTMHLHVWTSEEGTGWTQRASVRALSRDELVEFADATPGNVGAAIRVVAEAYELRIRRRRDELFNALADAHDRVKHLER